MPGRRSASVEPEDLVVASPRRRSARIAIRTDSPALALKKELAPEKSSIPARRTRRSLSIQEKSLNDIEKDVNAISHNSKSHIASSSQESEPTKSTARRTRRSASTQETQVLPDDLKKDDTPMPLKRSKRLQSKENSIDLAEEEDKPTPTDDAPAELVTTSARKRLTRSMSRSPTNTQKSKTLAPPIVKLFRNKLSLTDKNSEETKAVVLDIITENEDEIDKNENNTTKPLIETDLFNNNAKKLSEANMQTDQNTSLIDKRTTEDSAGKSDLTALSAGDGIIIETTDTESEVQSSELKLKDEMVLNTSVKSTTIEETNITVNCTNKFEIADKSVTENLLPNNDQNAFNESKTESINMENISVENIKVPQSSDKLDGSVKGTISTEEYINVSNRERNDANNYDFPINESESEKYSENSTVNKLNSILEKEDNNDLEADIEIIDDSDSKKKIENFDSTEETIEKLEITQEEEIMDKLEINEESGECKDNLSVSEELVNETLPINTNKNEDEYKMIVCTNSVKKKIHEENYELTKEVVAKPTEISDATAKGENETKKVIVTQNKVDILDLIEENMDTEIIISKQIEITDVVHSDVEQTNVEPMKQNGTLNNNVAEQKIDTEVCPNKMKETLETTNKNDLKVNNEANNKEDEIHDSENVKSNNEDDVTNISIVSDKTHSTVDTCGNEEHCESNISIVDSPDSNVSSTPIKNTRIEKPDSAKKEHERNLNLSLVNDDGKSYSPIINKIENISVDFEYSTSSIVDSSNSTLPENDVLNKNEKNVTGDNVELVTKDSRNEQSETSIEKKSKKSNKSSSKIPKEDNEISSENLESEEEELNNSIKEVNIKDNSNSEKIKKDEILNKSKRKNKTKILDSSCEENVDSSEEIEKTDVTKSKSPKKENNESSLAKEKLLDNESTEKSRDKMLDDFIDSFKADKKRKRQSFNDSVTENAQKQKKRRKHKNELNFSSESEENSDIDESRSRNKKRNKHTIDQSEDEESEEYEGNEFIDDMASEGSEETPSIDSNEIIDEGESVGSTDSQIDSDDDYEHGSFVVDDDVGNEELLSGSEEVECWTPKRKRIITIASDSDDELEKMSMEPFGGFSPSLMSVNQISSVDSDLETIKFKNEELSKSIEDKAISDTEDVDNKDLIIVNESMNKSESEKLESHAALKNKSHVEQIIKIDKIQKAVEELKNNDRNTGEAAHELKEKKSSETEQMIELNIDGDNKSLRKTSLNEKVNMEEIPGEKEKLFETNENQEISQEIIGEEKSVDKKDIIVEEKLPEKKVCNEIESNVEKEIGISSENIHEDKEKDARYKAVLDKYFKYFDDKILKSTRRRTMGMFLNETTKDSADIDITTKRKRRHSLDTEGKKSQNDMCTNMFETFYNESKKAKIPINDDNNDENMIDLKKGEIELKKTNSKVKKQTTDENTEGKIDDAVEQKCKKIWKSMKRHSLTNIENIPGKYVQSPGQLNKSFSDYSSSRETEIIQKYIKIDNSESATCMLKDFNDIVKDDIEVAKAYVSSPKKKKSRKSSDESILNDSGILVPSLPESNNTFKLEKSKYSPKKSLIEISPIKKDCETLKRKKKHNKSIETLVQEEVSTCEIIDTKEIEEDHTKLNKRKMQIMLETNDTDQAAKDNLEINMTINKQTKNMGNIKKNKQGTKLQSVASDVNEINREETGKEIKQKFKHSHFSKNDATANADMTTDSPADYLNDQSEYTGVKLIGQKNINNKKPREMSSSKSYPKNKNQSSSDDKFIVKKERAVVSKSEYDVVNEFVSRNINIYKNLIRPSGRGTTGSNIKVENLHAASIKIKKEKKKQKYNRSSKTDIPMAKASFTGQTTCNFKEEILFGSNVKRVAVSDILQKKRGVK